MSEREPNPFEPDCERCGDTGRAKKYSLRAIVGQPIDIGTPDRPGRDLHVTWIPCPDCRRANPTHTGDLT